MEFPSEEPIEPRVVYEDEWLVAVHKPARMHSAPGLGGAISAPGPSSAIPSSESLRGRGRPRGAPDGPQAGGEGGLLHRLDYETSGLVLFARTAAAFASLLDQQARGDIP